MLKIDFNEIVKTYKHTIITNTDICGAISFVLDLLVKEAAYIQQTEPYATNTIARFEQAAQTVFQLGRDIEEWLD
jgi:hypothetical protein